jgi:CBS-domain-containing membrane protein
MQQHNINYMMVDRDGVLESIVSKSDLMGAVSPYLRPAFTKWRRPLDDATLQIKIKRIIPKTVHTTGCDTPLEAIMEKMCRLHVQCLPVVDYQGKVQGLITEANIFQALLKQKTNTDAPAEDKAHKTPQVP